MAVWRSPEFDDHEQVCFFTDPASGLRAIVAIHSTRLGPAAGGTRFKTYADDDEALDDALKLSRAMSYKSALAGLPCGGGKAVIVGDPGRIKTRALLHAYGRFLNRIGDTFATGEDVGVTVADMETVREVTPYVGGTLSAGAGDPSIHTATGVMYGLRAVLERQFERGDFRDITVAIQGLGAVGWNLARYLHAEGARLVVADVRHERVERAVAELGAVAAPTERIHEAEADIYSPCALGGGINAATVPTIRARAVAGAANNQLASPEAGDALAARGILFAPDYVINAGGMIGAAEELSKVPGRVFAIDRPVEDRLAGIHRRLIELFNRAHSDRATPEATAARMAQELIGR